MKRYYPSHRIKYAKGSDLYLLNSIRFNKSLNKTDLPRKMPPPLLMALAAEAHLVGQSRGTN